MSDFLFISDLHLADERPHIIKLFLRFLDEIAPTTRSLYILGDFLEYWIGDDRDDELHGSLIQDVFNSLKALKAKGTDTYLMHGNRDFLVGKTLAEKYQFTLIDDPTVIHIDYIPVLLMHGDTLCTDDIDYQNFRIMVRDSAWQKDFLSKPIEERKEIADALRKTSKNAIADKKQEIMDVNLDAVIKAMKDNGTDILIHGHTHRPAVHDFDVSGKPMKRYVLADWYDSGSYLEVTDGAYRVSEFSDDAG